MVLNGESSFIVADLVGDGLLTHSEGIADPTSWYTTGFVADKYSDMDAALEEFFRLCSLAGPSLCKFWHPTTDKIREAFWDLDNRLHSSPVVLPSLQVLDWSAWRAAAIAALYTPMLTFTGNSGLADIAAAASNPNSTANANLTLPNSDTTAARELWLTDPVTGFKNGEEALAVIRCLDHPKSTITGVEQFEDFLESEPVQRLGRLGRGAAGYVGTFCGRTFLPLSRLAYGRLLTRAVQDSTPQAPNGSTAASQTSKQAPRSCS